MRTRFFPILVGFCGIVMLLRLFSLQILSDEYGDLSLKNSVLKQYVYPERGYMFDRNGKLLVSNQPMYDLMVVPKNLRPFDTLDLCTMLRLTKQELNVKIAKAKRYSMRAPSVLLNQISKQDYAALQEKMWKFPGMYIQRKSVRAYQTDVASNILGYISEVNYFDMETNPYYKRGELIGRQGIEKTYEEILRGKKGVTYLQRDKFSRIIGPYKEQKLDTLPTPAQDITLSIDIDLQEYGTKLLANKRGGILAIEPSTGEILMSVSTPTYAPNLLVGRERSENFNLLKQDTLNRYLFDRSLQGQYPPGSPFKVLNALVALEEGVITPKATFTCYSGHFYARNQFMECKCKPGSKNNLDRGIHNSCNTYFSNVYRRIIDKDNNAPEGINTWHDHLRSFGLGNYLGYDHPVGQSGYVPNANFYNLWYPNQRWRGATTVSNAIGQGEILMTPIQLANVAATIANRGFYYTPHFVKGIQGDFIAPQYKTKQYTTISDEHFIPVVEGMANVVKKGTARIAAIRGIEVCGKTGTIENFTKIKGVRTQLTDHSMFIAFAPKDDPKIAIAVIVENGYWGGRWAAPIASLVIEKYLKGEVKRTWLEKRMINGSLEAEYAKVTSNEPFEINE
ncbi:MAG: penicillin-binding protein 2 [Bacteroidetes bacterium]|nr:penicillin-binding protein 2 [Bacteroidota bacterium]